ANDPRTGVACDNPCARGIGATQQPERSGRENMAASLLHSRVGGTMVLVHSTRLIDASDWAGFVQALESEDIRGLIVWTPGAAPNSVQRNQVREVLQRRAVNIAVFTDSLAARSVGGVLKLLTSGQIQVFRPGDFEPAYDHAQVQQADRARVTET